MFYSYKFRRIRILLNCCLIGCTSNVDAQCSTHVARSMGGVRIQCSPLMESDRG